MLAWSALVQTLFWIERCLTSYCVPTWQGERGRKGQGGGRGKWSAHKLTSSVVSLLMRTLNLMYWGPTLRTSFDLNYLLIDPISKCHHRWGQFQHMKFGSSVGGWGGADHNSVHSKILSFWSEDTHSVCLVQFLNFQSFPTKAVSSQPNFSIRSHTRYLRASWWLRW